MKMKRLITTVAILSIIGVGSAYAFPGNGAQGGKDLPKNHPPVNRAPVEKLSEADMDAWLKLHEKHAQKVEPIRNVLTARRMELKALENNTKVTPEYLRNLTEEIVNLQTRIAKLDNAFFEESAEKFNLDLRAMQERRDDRREGRAERRDDRRDRRDNCDDRREGRHQKQGDGNAMGAPRHQGYHSDCPFMHMMMLQKFHGDCPEMRGMPPHHGAKKGDCPEGAEAKKDKRHERPMPKDAPQSPEKQQAPVETAE